MAEGGGEFGYEDPALDNQLDHDDDDDDEEQEVNRSKGFQPGVASTPKKHGGETMVMQTMQHEQTGLPETASEEIPLLGAQAEQQRSWDYLTRVFPEASATNLETEYSKTGRLQVKMMGFGKKLYDLFTKEKRTGKQRLNPRLSDEIKDSLGPMAQELVDRENETIRTERQNLRDAEKKLKEAETLEAEREKASQEVQELRQRNEKIQASIDAIQGEQGSNVESEAELHRLKQLKKNLQTDFENAKREVAALEKQAKNKEEEQAKVDRLLPGLIGSIVNFLFKAAGQAIGFLAEHTWLLILAAVAFLFKKYIKKRR